MLDGLRQDIGLMYLLEEQGYIVKIVVIYSYTRSSHMLADFYTKPRQSEIFRKMRDQMMGVVSIVNSE